MENKFCKRSYIRIHLLADTVYIGMMMTWVTFLMLCINYFITIEADLHRHLMSSLKKKKEKTTMSS